MSWDINLINWKRKSVVVLNEKKNEVSLKSNMLVKEQKCFSVARKQRFCQICVVFEVGFVVGFGG